MPMADARAVRLLSLCSAAAALGGMVVVAAAWRRRAAQIDALLRFWFDGTTAELYASRWFVPAGSAALAALDQTIAKRYGALLAEAETGRLEGWVQHGPRGLLALIILLDQFSRHVHRGDQHAVQRTDERALSLAQQMLARGWNHRLSATELVFALMPMRHSPTVERLEQVRRPSPAWASKRCAA
mgnify:CR=1 FL=1|eukprot:scaffold58943_cov31-Tisochrysis_lutea.AAC.1